MIISGLPANQWDPNVTALTTNGIGLTDGIGLDIGSVLVEDRRAGLILGRFQSGAEYASVEPLFRYFAELVEDQVLSLTDEAGQAIDRLGLTAHVDGIPVKLHDIQIYADGAGSFRYTPV